MRTKEWLREKRIKYSFTQRQLANKIGLSPYTIEQIEQGKRLGSIDTWNKIETFFQNADDVKNDSIVSYDSFDIIEELEEDIEEYGNDKDCILFYKIVDNKFIIFTDYTFNVEEMPFDPKKELKADEYYIETTLKYALEVFENQNKIF